MDFISNLYAGFVMCEEPYRLCIKKLKHKMKITQTMLVDITEINFYII